MDVMDARENARLAGMRTVADVYPSEWLRSEDLRGQAVRVMVARATVQEFRQRDGSMQAKIVVAFAGKQKRLICNVTQAKAFAEITRTEAFGEWRGQTVVLAPAKASNGKDTIAVLRVELRSADQEEAADGMKRGSRGSADRGTGSEGSD